MANEGGSATVLVVDDDPRALRLMQVVLEHDGYRVLTAGDGPAAQAVLAQTLPDLIISDFMMPGMNGIELLVWVKRQSDGVTPKRMLLTAMDAADNSLAAAAQDIDAVLTKPVERAVLLERVAGLLGRGGEARAAP